MDPSKHLAASSDGGKAGHRQRYRKKAHEWTAAEASAAGKVGAEKRKTMAMKQAERIFALRQALRGINCECRELHEPDCQSSRAASAIFADDEAAK
jgi:hypothetical protein